LGLSGPYHIDLRAAQVTTRVAEEVERTVALRAKVGLAVEVCIFVLVVVLVVVVGVNSQLVSIVL